MSKPATPHGYNTNKQASLAARTGTKAQSTNRPATHTDCSRQQSGWFVLERRSSREASKHAALCHFKRNITEADGASSRRKRFSGISRSQFSVARRSGVHFLVLSTSTEPCKHSSWSSFPPSAIPFPYISHHQC